MVEVIKSVLDAYSCLNVNAFDTEGPSMENSHRVRARGSGFTKDASILISALIGHSFGALKVSTCEIFWYFM